jgi:hypothetical protein
MQITGEKVNLRHICRKLTTAARRGLKLKNNKNMIFIQKNILQRVAQPSSDIRQATK